jgi:hypothetical protein
MSRRLKRAAIISRLFFAAFLISLSRLLFLFEMLAIGDLSFENAWHRLVEPRIGLVNLRNDSLEEAVKREMNENELVSARSLAQSVQSVDPKILGEI